MLKTICIIEHNQEINLIYFVVCRFVYSSVYLFTFYQKYQNFNVIHFLRTPQQINIWEL